MEATESLSSAIKEIERITKEASQAQTVTVTVNDKVEGSLDVPIALLRDSEGATSLESLTGLAREAVEFARQERLRHAAGPDKREGTAALQSLESFIGHANRFKAESSAVWADAAQRKLVSVLDYHPAGAESPARWGRHRGLYACPLSEAWLGWGGGKPLVMDQDEFAALLDSRDRELASGKLVTGVAAPDPASLITLASNLEVYSHATAKRERDPNTGRVKISFTEEKGVSGTVMPPPSFLIQIPVFQDGIPQLLEVRLRVAVEDGEAKFTVQIHAANDVLRNSFAELCSRVSTGTSLPVFIGTPE